MLILHFPFRILVVTLKIHMINKLKSESVSHNLGSNNIISTCASFSKATARKMVNKILSNSKVMNQNNLTYNIFPDGMVSMFIERYYINIVVY